MYSPDLALMTDITYLMAGAKWYSLTIFIIFSLIIVGWKSVHLLEGIQRFVSYMNLFCDTTPIKDWLLVYYDQSVQDPRLISKKSC